MRDRPPRTLAQHSVATPEYLYGAFDGGTPPIAVIDNVIGGLSPEEHGETQDLRMLAQQQARFGDKDDESRTGLPNDWVVSRSHPPKQ